MTRQVRTADETHMFSVEREILQPSIRPIRDQQQWILAPQIDRNSVRTIELPGFLAFSAEGADKFALAVVLIDIAGPVSVADVDISVRRDGQIGGTIFDL